MTPPSRAERWAVLSAQIFLVAWAAFYLALAAKNAFWFDGVPDDGPFQIFDPMRRIAAGQVGGRDFIFFHGIGVPYLNYMLFALFGGKSLIASELSRQLTSFLLFIISLGVFAWITLKRSPRAWIGVAASVIAIEALFPMSPAPGHSLESLRSTMPIFAFAALQLPMRAWLKAAAAGLFVGVGFVCGTEHGIGLALALILVSAFTLAQEISRKGKPTDVKTGDVKTGDVKTGDVKPAHVGLSSIRFLAIAFTAAGISAAFLFLLLCGVNGSLKAIHYNLVELPVDQFWFFGSPPLPFLGSWSEFLTDHHVFLCFLPTLSALILLGWVLVKVWNRPLRLGRDWQALAILMLIYGILTFVPLLGILSRHYVFPLARTMVLLGLLVFANGRLPSRWSVTRWQPLWPVAASVAFIGVSVFTAVPLAYNSTISTLALVRHIRSNSNTYSPFLDSHWDSFMTEATQLIDSKRKRPTVSLWSVYSALLESHYGIFSSAEDYIIHAVGPARWHNYLATFKKDEPEFVQTRTQTFDFQEWQQNERWEFFEDLLNNYTPLKTIGHALFWQRMDQPWQVRSEEFQTLEFDQHRRSVVLPVISGPDRIGVVKVRYRVSNPWAWVPLLGKTPRYLALIEGSPRNLTISFPQYETQFQFPVQLQSGKAVTLKFRTDTLIPSAAFDPYEVQIKILDRQPSQSAIYGRESLGERQ